MPLGPAPQFPERFPNVYERKAAPDMPGNRGPLRFEEGIATDTDIPNGFVQGMGDAVAAAPGRPNRNAMTFRKEPQETVAERAHVGSASWVEAPTFLQEFAQGSFNDAAEVEYEMVRRSGQHYLRLNPATVED